MRPVRPATTELRHGMRDIVSVDCIVRRKSGGPMMLVTAISDGGPQDGLIAVCEWPHGEGITRAFVPVDELISMTRI